MFTTAGLVTMIVVTLLYGNDLGAAAVLKYWAIFLVLGAGLGLLLNSTMFAAIVQVGTAIVMFSKAKFAGALD